MGVRKGAAELMGAALQGECEPWRILKAERIKMPWDGAQAFGEKYAERRASYRDAGQKQGASPGPAWANVEPGPLP